MDYETNALLFEECDRLILKAKRAINGIDAES